MQIFINTKREVALAFALGLQINQKKLDSTWPFPVPGQDISSYLEMVQNNSQKEHRYVIALFKLGCASAIAFK